ncbi:cytochrome c oxidase subunit II [Methyloversatilis sp.]|uniref:cytochrome c oxidase subunit II n=1 Tax=Methyloversatilis sp. TaxID=2569862 RepID=UPI0027350204|nr:cytochrome c oxidase subunit II [Methyloversatilis sp.]MDP2868842.1 cytochrome c oxidase subunit II [Methyloversatilis sp.]MDP3288082.1 cytochrome c oxidase subunit II [Methyloversatilis sp.]MDP3457497.1 cytochrome c oxidase subunit II [Methyloversatilis sp.]MDP3579356.1 cytochrome c oxidase subunit II [Methyloversatilis sp.]
MKLNLQEPITALGRDVYDLHLLMTIVCGVIFVAVFGVMFWSVFVHRKSAGYKAATFHESTTVEILWTIVPVFILLGMAWPATKTILAMRDTTNADITIKVTGYQWKWGYDYLKGEGEGINFVSTLSTPQPQVRNEAPKGENYLLEVDNELVVPVGKKIRILTTANDVIHAWWVPALAVKQDAIPGFIRDTWFRAEKTGTYRGQCAELCGKEHGYMPIVVKIVTEDEYAAWVDDKKKAMAAAADDPNKMYLVEELTPRGEKVFAANCAACHQANGQGLPPAFPGLVGSKVVLGPQDGQIDILLNGKSGTAMAAFKHLSDTELAAVITYTRNSWGNATGEVVQPSDIKVARE